LNLPPPGPDNLSFQLLWCHPGKPAAAVWLRQDGMVEFSSDLTRRNSDKKNGSYVVKYARGATEGRLEETQELEVMFHYDGVDALAKTTLLHPLNTAGVFRAAGTKTNGKRKYFELTWEDEQLKNWHVVAILQPVVV